MIDYVILSNTRTEKDYAMTSGLLSSLGNTVYPAENGFESYRVTIVENSPGCGGFRYPASCDVVFFDIFVDFLQGFFRARGEIGMMESEFQIV